MHFYSRRRFISLAIAKVSMLGVGCGTVLHPERRGQPAGPLDWSIVALDAIGLFFFFIPGVIAFAVDFNNGTIYLPPDRYGLNRHNRGQQLVSVPVPTNQLTVHNVEKIVSERSQRDIRLKPGSVETQQLKSIDDFWATTDRMAST